MVAKNRMPVFRIIDMHGTYGKILYDRIYIFGTNRTLKEAVDQLGIKGDRNIRTVFLILHFTGM